MNTLKIISSLNPVRDFAHSAIDRLICNMNVFLFLLWLLVPTLSMAAEDQFEFTTSDSGSIITGYTGPGGAVVIPNELGGSPVSGIADEAFLDNRTVTAITFPNSVTKIGDYAFSGCWGLISVTVPNGVTSIGNYTFSRCVSLASVTLPNSVTKIGDYAFSNSTILMSINLPDSVTTIGNGAFYGCVGLNTVNIPDSVTTIGSTAFFYCDPLTTITIPASVTSIGDSAFYCRSLRTIDVDEVNPSYSSVDGVFFDKSKATLIQYPAQKNANHYTIPNSVTTIGESAFANCWNLASINIPQSVTTIEFGAFYGSSFELKRIFFAGDAPNAPGILFTLSSATMYYLPGTVGWSATFADQPTVLWNPQILTGDGMLGVQDGKFGFTVSGAADVPVVVEACNDLADPIWTTVTSLTFNAQGTAVFSDPDSADQPGRFYRFRPE